MIGSLPPGWILIFGSLLIPLLRGRLRSAYMLLLPAIGFGQLLWLQRSLSAQLEGGVVLHRVSTFAYSLDVVRVDRLSLVFGLIFYIATFLAVIYALRVNESGQHVAALVYAGSAIGAAFAGDLITLFVYWELLAVSSVFLIWAGRTERSYKSGMRYLIVHVASGVLLLLGTVAHYFETGSIAFGHLGLDGLGGQLIFIAFGIKCAFPLLHNWLQDSYPEATVTGTVFLSVFTTKLAVYALARGFAGVEILIWIGVTMTIFPIFFAVIENDLRRVLAYSLNNQLGFMVVGIGVGTEMALNGTAAHAFAHILYKSLLFMSMGAVLHRAGTIKASELGGLYKSMPWTTTCCIIGSLSISGLPLFSGFVSKSMILTGAVEAHYAFGYILLLFASAGVVDHSGIKIPFFAFFAHDSGIRCKEAPPNMLIAMGLTSLLCVLIGIFPRPLYDILPYPVDFDPYTPSHVITVLQLLVFALLSFVILARKHLETPEVPSVNVDTDWVYRKLLPSATAAFVRVGAPIRDTFIGGTKQLVSRLIDGVKIYHGPDSLFARTWMTGRTVLLVTVFLLGYLILYF
ncbi:MAG: Na(+)/H(+) antiporter subunit D [Acidobacteria bacterium]|nr:Na(+)/H(+) antiporter subunit D [Acidobacteriota bacterium]